MYRIINKTGEEIEDAGPIHNNQCNTKINNQFTTDTNEHYGDTLPKPTQ